MADGKWVMTEEDDKRVDLTFSGSGSQNLRELPNHGQHRSVDDRDGKAEVKCSFCGSDELQSGFGGCGEGFGYRSFMCRSCGGTTDFVYKDEIEKYFR
jgi:hypothetical protein